MIIALGHKSKSGKSIASKILHHELVHLCKEQWHADANDICIQIIPFARKLKQSCYALYNHFGLKSEIEYDDKPELKDIRLPKIDKTPRKIWIDYGETVCNNVYDRTFIDYVLQRNRNILIIPDLRKLLELTALQEIQNNEKENVFLVKMNRSRQIEFDLDQQLDSFTKWHFDIDNNGSLDYLRPQMRQIATIAYEEYMNNEYNRNNHYNETGPR